MKREELHPFKRRWCGITVRNVATARRLCDVIFEAGIAAISRPMRSLMNNSRQPLPLHRLPLHPLGGA